MILAFNVSSAMKRLALGKSWAPRRMKAVRFWLINLPGRVLERGRKLFVRLAGGIRPTRSFSMSEGGCYVCAAQVSRSRGQSRACRGLKRA